MKFKSYIKESKMSDSEFDKIYNHVIKNNGITYDPKSKKLVSSGFSVAIDGVQPTLINKSGFNVNKLEKAYNKLLPFKTNEMFGGWLDSGKWYFEKSVVIKNKKRL